MAQQQILKVIWTKTAQIQFLSILEYWTKRNKSASFATHLSKRVWEKIEALKMQPFSSPKADFTHTRQAVLGHYCLFYEIRPSTSVITAFWDNRQDPKTLLDILLKTTK